MMIEKVFGTKENRYMTHQEAKKILSYKDYLELRKKKHIEVGGNTYYCVQTNKGGFDVKNHNQK